VPPAVGAVARWGAPIDVVGRGADDRRLAAGVGAARPCAF